MPRKAIREGITGTVVAKIKVTNCVVEVAIVSGPRIFHDEVTKAIKQYKCIPNAEELTFIQEFSFKID